MILNVWIIENNTEKGKQKYYHNLFLNHLIEKIYIWMTSLPWVTDWCHLSERIDHSTAKIIYTYFSFTIAWFEWVDYIGSEAWLSKTLPNTSFAVMFNDIPLPLRPRLLCYTFEVWWMYNQYIECFNLVEMNYHIRGVKWNYIFWWSKCLTSTFGLRFDVYCDVSAKVRMMDVGVELCVSAMSVRKEL